MTGPHVARRVQVRVEAHDLGVARPVTERSLGNGPQRVTLGHLPHRAGSVDGSSSHACRVAHRRSAGRETSGVGHRSGVDGTVDDDSRRRCQLPQRRRRPTGAGHRTLRAGDDTDDERGRHQPRREVRDRTGDRWRRAMPFAAAVARQVDGDLPQHGPGDLDPGDPDDHGDCLDDRLARDVLLLDGAVGEMPVRYGVR